MMMMRAWRSQSRLGPDARGGIARPARRWAAAHVVALAVLASGCSDATGPVGEAQTLDPPVPGEPMVDIFYGAYVDHAPAGGPVVDYTCGRKSYPGHRGTDILLANFQDQDAGVPVRAAAGGTVSQVLDGRADRNTSRGAGVGFGNHVVISHEDGETWTIYGHLRRHSVEVEVGEAVSRGQRLGLVGSSGSSDWPHLHFEVRRGGAAVDPFQGPCGAETSLWRDELPYQDRFEVTDHGLLDEPVPSGAQGLAVLLERPVDVEEILLDAESLVYWLQLANQPAGQMRLEIVGPDGMVREERTREAQFGYSLRFVVASIEVSEVLVETGTWTLRIYQDGALLASRTVEVVAPGNGSAAGAAASELVRVREEAIDLRVFERGMW